MNKPNFLIVGAQKSGTTSLYNYLNQHPEIFMCPIKEPGFFVFHFLKLPHQGIGDYQWNKKIRDFNDYTRLFSAVKNETMIGEASVSYLYHYKGAIPKIIEMLGDVKIVIILRNPVERAYSAYMHLVRDDRECLSFEDGLEEEAQRIADNWNILWHYTSVGFYYKQVQAYLENFSQVKVFLFDDLKKDPQGLLKGLYGFLGVDDAFVPGNLGERYNATGIPKNRFIYNLLKKPNRIKSMIKPFISERKRRKVRERIVKHFVKTKPDMEPDTRARLVELFKEDILALQDLIDRDLTCWLEQKQ